jgi:hypothetical protein
MRLCLALTCCRSSTSVCPMRLSMWSRSNRSRTKQIAAAEADRISEASTEAIGEGEACAGADEAAEEEAVVVLEDCEWIRLRRYDSLRYTVRGCTCQGEAARHSRIVTPSTKSRNTKRRDIVSRSACLHSSYPAEQVAKKPPRQHHILQAIIGTPSCFNRPKSSSANHV